MARRFQLVFRSGDTERTETRDTNSDGAPHVDGNLIVDGQTYVIRGVDWLLTADDFGDTKRFLCTLVAEPRRPRRGRVNLSGSEVRIDNVRLLVSLLDGDETAAKLERGIQHGNPIVALSLADRERIVAVLASDAPSGLVELHAVLVKQLKHRHDRERSAQRMRLDQARIQRRREGP